MKRHASWIASLVLSAGLVPTTAAAQTFQEGQEFSVERFELPSDRAGLIGVEWGEVPKHLAWGVSLWLGGANDPLVLNAIDATGKSARVGSLVRTRVGGSLMASLALFDWVGLTVDVPLVLYQGRGDSIPGVQDSLQSLSRFGMGTPRVVPKLRLLRQADHGISLALLPTFTFPQVKSGDYFGDRGWGFAPSLALSHAFRYLRLSIDTGVRLREDQSVLNVQVTDELFARAGAGLTLKDFGLPPIQVDLSVSMATRLKDPFAQDYQDHVELLSGLRYDFSSLVVAFAGAGVGIERGFGTPDWRVFAGLRFTGLLARDEEPRMRMAPPQVVQLAPCCTDGPKQPEDDAWAAMMRQPRPTDVNRALPIIPTATKAESVELREVVLFEYGRDKVEPEFASLLAAAARKALKHPELGKLTIIGHTDFRGTEGFNNDLSKRRAKAVQRFLLAMGLPEARLEIQYRGEDAPMARNDMAEGRMLNRRVEVVTGEVEGLDEAPPAPNGDDAEHATR